MDMFSAAAGLVLLAAAASGLTTLQKPGHPTTGAVLVPLVIAPLMVAVLAVRVTTTVLRRGTGI
jgi:hypothetical protein